MSGWHPRFEPFMAYVYEPGISYLSWYFSQLFLTCPGISLH